MSDERLEPMDDELRALLWRGAPRDDVPAGAEERLFARLAATLPIGPGPGGGGGAGSVVSTKLAAALVAAGVVVGGGIGAAVTRATMTDAVRIVYVDRPATSESVPAAIPSPPPAAHVEEVPSAAPPSIAPRTSAASPTTSSASQMNAERVLLDAARTSFARGDYTAALDALDRHRRAYPSGLLTEEREALAVRTLGALGRTDEARARGRAFLSTHPSSVMVPAVEAAMSASPDGG